MFTGCPIPDVPGSVEIGVLEVSAMGTAKLSLAFTIGFGAVAAGVTRPAGVARIYQDDWNAVEFCFVLDELAELKERPVTETRSESLGNSFLGSVSDSLEILKSDTQTKCLCFRDEPFADSVILLFLKTSLSARHTFQFTFGSLSSFSLKGLPRSFATLSQLGNLCSGEHVARRVGSDVDDTQINTEELGGFDRRIFGYVDSAMQEELVVSINQIGLTFEVVQLPLLVLAMHIRNDDSTSHGQQTDFVGTLEPEGVMIVSNRTERLKNRTLGLIYSEGLDSLTNRTNSSLRANPKSIPKFSVASAMYADLGEDFGVKRDSGGVRCRLVEDAHVLQQSLSLRRVR